MSDPYTFIKSINETILEFQKFLKILLFPTRFCFESPCFFHDYFLLLLHFFFVIFSSILLLLVSFFPFPFRFLH